MSKTVNVIKSLSIQDSSSVADVRRILHNRPEPVAMTLGFFKPVATGFLIGSFSPAFDSELVMRTQVVTHHQPYRLPQFGSGAMPLRRPVDQPMVDDRVMSDIYGPAGWSFDRLTNDAFQQMHAAQVEFLSRHQQLDQAPLVPLLQAMGIDQHLFLVPESMAIILYKMAMGAVRDRPRAVVDPVSVHPTKMYVGDLPYYTAALVEHAFATTKMPMSHKQAESLAEEMNFTWSFEQQAVHLLPETILSRSEWLPWWLTNPSQEEVQWESLVHACYAAWEQMVRNANSFRLIPAAERTRIDARHAELAAQKQSTDSDQRPGREGLTRRV